MPPDALNASAGLKAHRRFNRLYSAFNEAVSGGGRIVAQASACDACGPTKQTKTGTRFDRFRQSSLHFFNEVPIGHGVEFLHSQVSGGGRIVAQASARDARGPSKQTKTGTRFDRFRQSSLRFFNDVPMGRSVEFLHSQVSGGGRIVAQASACDARGPSKQTKTGTRFERLVVSFTGYRAATARESDLDFMKAAR